MLLRTMVTQLAFVRDDMNTARSLLWASGIAAALMLSACDGSDGVDGSNGVNGVNSLIQTAPEPAGVNCPNGGSRITAGPDRNVNGALDSGEVQSTTYTCNGGNANGTPVNTLVGMAVEAAGANCPAGGSKVMSGPDANNNAVLDTGEVTATSYVCNAGNDVPHTLLAIAAEAAGANCPLGGNKITSGADSNTNGVLDSNEVSATNYICNVGGTGINALVRMIAEPVGPNCSAGGSRIASGADTNGNGALDSAEVTSTSYLCNGANGSNGAAGNPGTPGSPGVPGNPGSDGLTTLVGLTVEPAGAHCTFGGNKVSAGADSNSNGFLDSAEITVTSYLCNGAPGAGITWVGATGTAVQATSNTGYLANSSDPVVITLPPSPAPGDIIEVTGVGVGGWKIAQNAGQRIALDNNVAGGDIGATWIPQPGITVPYGVAASSDGKRLVVASHGGQLYTSADAGANWTPRDSVRQWSAVASSSDGTKLLAAVDSGYLYTSTNAGVTWTQRTTDTTRVWLGVASSADGLRLVAAAFNGYLYTSDDGGVSWTARMTDSTRAWEIVASSADGSRLIATGSGLDLYTSEDFGMTWTSRGLNRSWTGVASSADGMRLVASASGDYVYTSSDGGVTWTAHDTGRTWQAVASSSDGTRLAAGTWTSGIYTSTDSGQTWTLRTGAITVRGLASSADGSILAAASNPVLVSSPSTKTTTSTGTAGYLAGRKHDSVALQYIGGGVFVVKNAAAGFLETK